MHESKRKQEAVSFEELSEKASGILRKHPERKRDPIPDEPLDPGRRSLWGVEKRLRIPEISAPRENESKTGDSFIEYGL